MTDPTTRGRGGRPRKGSLYWTKSGWRARLTIDVDGVPIQRSFDLETRDRQVAKIKLRRLVKQDTSGSPVGEMATEAKRAETFEEAAERVVGDSTIRTKQARLHRLRLHAFPAIGSKLVNEVVAGDVRSILEGLATAGASKQQCLHVRNDISAVLGDLWRTDMLPDNVTTKVRIPKGAKVDTRERAVLRDDELLAYIAWQHPNEKRQRAVLERQVMACVSRVFGGLRWGDIRALRWENFDTGDGAFAVGWAPRKKSARAQALVVPDVLRPILRDWWERQGKPAAGHVFPVRKGERAGEERKAGSVAKALRRDISRAFGIEAPQRVQLERSNNRKDTRDAWRVARKMTPRERELLEETEFTRPVDFHSFRRAFKQGLADANVDVQQSMALSGATDMAAHQRYLKNTGKVRVIPAAALPRFSMTDAETPKAENENQQDSQCRETDLNRRHHAYEARALTS